MSGTFPRPARSRSATAAVFVLAALAVAIGALESMPLPALPLIQRELGLDPAQAALVTTTLLLTGSVTMPVVAKLADARGGLRVLLVLAWCIVVGGTVSAFAGSLPLMVVGQFLQGLGIAVVPVAFVVLRELFPERMSVAVGAITGCFTVGGGVGVLTAGPLADALSRRWMFLLPTLLVAVLALAAQIGFGRRAGSAGRAARLDWAGALLLAGALAALTLALSWIPRNGWISIPTGTLLAVTAGLGAAWVFVERRAAEPMVDLAMLARRGMWSSSVVAAVLGAGYAVPYFLFPQLLAMPPAVAGFGFGASASAISGYLLPAVAVAVVVGPVTGLLVRRVGSRAVVAGGLVVTAAGILFAAVWHGAPWHIVLSMLATIGLGVGAAFTALYTGVIDSVDKADTGVATAINGIARGIGLSFGVQLSAVLVVVPLAVVRFVPGRARASRQADRTQKGCPAGLA